MAVKRIYLKDLHRMMDGMSIELAEKGHLLFMNNYINYSNYEFRDEWQVDFEECPMWKEADLIKK